MPAPSSLNAALVRSLAPPSIRRLRELAEANATILAVTLAVGLILGDYLSGVELTFTLLYVAPIAAAAWWRGRGMGLGIAVLCVSGAAAADIVTRLMHGRALHPARLCWNFGGSFVLFAL